LFSFRNEEKVFFSQSSRAGEALMRSNWTTFDGSIQREMIIVLANAIKPVELTAGNFIKVNIEEFLAVIKTAFSYYTLMKNLKEKSRV
jgi:7tm Odorant receptor